MQNTKCETVDFIKKKKLKITFFWSARTTSSDVSLYSSRSILFVSLKVTKNLIHILILALT